MNVLVTGGAGFIGSNLVDKLIELDYNVTILDDLSTGKEENINPKAKFIKCDISDKSSIDIKHFFDVEVVFHLSALARVQMSIENPIPFHDKNVNGTLNVLELSRIAKVRRFVFSSSSSLYGDTKQLPTTENADYNPISP